MERTTSVAKVQMVVLSDGERTWTVLGADHLPIAPVEEFLEHHRVVGSSPNTVKSYAHGLALWWRYLEGTDVRWDDPRVSTVTGVRVVAARRRGRRAGIGHPDSCGPG
jgi:hypothetical protein